MLEEISYEAQPLVPRLLDELNTGQKRVDQESKHIIKNQNTLHPAVRSKISSKLIFLQAVCDTPIARITSCVSSFKDIGRPDSPCNYSVAIRVNRVMLVSLCAETMKTRF